MSGTSLDGVDAALVETDGHRVFATGARRTDPYPEDLRSGLRALVKSGGSNGDLASVERAITLAHAAAVHRLLRMAGADPTTITVIGFHGHTLRHAPQERRSWQIGDARLLAQETGIDVVYDFRAADIAAGGEGAPLAPLFHAALLSDRPAAVLNIGGLANLTYIGPTILAFDTGPGNALIDDWMWQRTGAPYDAGGALAATGTPQDAILQRLMDHPFFARRPPKSLDREAFDPAPVAELSTADGAATLTAFTVAAVAAAWEHLPEQPPRLVVTGGGRHNHSLMAGLNGQFGPQTKVVPAEAVGWDGDALEAQAFAYLAVRSLQGLPLSMPGTTGVPEPLSGGRLARFVPPGRPVSRSRIFRQGLG